MKFLDYALREGPGAAEKLDYVPFPDTVVKQIEASWNRNPAHQPLEFET